MQDKSTERLLAMSEELIEIFRADPSALPKEDYQKAKKMIAVFENPQFGSNFKNLKELKVELYKECLVCVAEGADPLKSGVYQIFFKDGGLTMGHKLFGDPQEGELIYSIGLKDFMAFQGFREKEADDLDQETLNCLSLYFIYSLANAG